jgi:iron(III)-enterobactin esterase
MTENEHFELPADNGGMPFVIFFPDIHITKLLKKTQIAIRQFCPEGIPQKILIFGDMEMEKSTGILQDSVQLKSVFLRREVQVDFYMAGEGSALSPSMSEFSLLLINDGQELGNMGFSDILDELYSAGKLRPLLCVGIHAGPERMMEYGTADLPDYLGRGAQAAAYSQFVMEELIPAIRGQYKAPSFKEKAFAGFSLGALSAMDIVWHHAEEFSRAGLFSGSFWWRTKDKSDPVYNEHTDRIMQKLVREGGYYPWLKFFFECGTEDELEDRNHNGIIDSIDDTVALIRELVDKGYAWEELRESDIVETVNRIAGEPEPAIRYLEIEGGKHEVGTWARAMTEFLEWGWGSK